MCEVSRSTAVRVCGRPVAPVCLCVDVAWVCARCRGAAFYYNLFAFDFVWGARTKYRICQAHRPPPLPSSLTHRGRRGQPLYSPHSFSSASIMTTELPRITTMPTLFCSLADTCAFENQARISHQSLSRAIAPRLWSPQVSGIEGRVTLTTSTVSSSTRFIN